MNLINNLRLAYWKHSFIKSHVNSTIVDLRNLPVQLIKSLHFIFTLVAKLMIVSSHDIWSLGHVPRLYFIPIDVDRLFCRIFEVRILAITRNRAVCYRTIDFILIFDERRPARRNGRSRHIYRIWNRNGLKIFWNKCEWLIAIHHLLNYQVFNLNYLHFVCALQTKSLIVAVRKVSLSNHEDFWNLCYVQL